MFVLVGDAWNVVEASDEDVGKNNNHLYIKIMKANLFKKGGKMMYGFFLLFLIGLSAYIATTYHSSSVTMEGAVGGPALDLGNVANMSNVACAGMWKTLPVAQNGYTMVNALQEPDGTCIVDFMDTNGVYYTQTLSNKTTGVISAATPNANATPSAKNLFNENKYQKTIV